MNPLLLLPFSFLACGDRDDSGGVDNTGWELPEDSGVPTDGGGADGGGADGGGADGGGADGGGSDGGGSDGGGSDGGSDEPALLSFGGEASVEPLDSYEGSHRVFLTADKGDGDLLCEVEVVLSAEGVRSDCKECDWAFDLVVTDASSVVDLRCDAIGLDASAVAALVGTVRSYGFIPEYFGHAPTLMMDSDGTWVPLAYAAFDDTTGALSYEGVDGYVKF